MFIRNDVGFTR